MTPQGSLRRSAANGIAWLTVQSLGSRVLGLLSQLVLAWILVPADFGKIGLAYTVSGVAGALVGFGIEDVLLHRRRAIHLWSASAFGVSLGLGFVGMLFTSIAGFVGAAVYDDASLVVIIQILAAAMPLGALSTIPSAHLRSSMNFRFLATYNIFENFLMQVMIIALAAYGAGPYSFAIPVPILAALRAACLWYSSRQVINWKVKPAQFRALLSKGSASAGEKLLIESVSQCDYILLGVLASQTTVGLYFFAFRLAAQPIRTLAASFQNVVLSALSHLKSEPARQAEAAYRTAQILAFIVVPVCFLQAALIHPFIIAFFGTKWQESILLVQILSIGLPFDAVSWVVGALLKARGQFRTLFLFSLLFAPIFILAVAVGAILASATGVALAVSACYLSMPVFLAVVVFQRLGIPPARTFAVFTQPLIVAIPIVGGVYVISLLELFSSRPIIQMAFLATVAPTMLVGAMVRWFPGIVVELGKLVPFKFRVTDGLLERLDGRKR